jgi:hypothetical protein
MRRWIAGKTGLGAVLLLSGLLALGACAPSAGVSGNTSSSTSGTSTGSSSQAVQILQRVKAADLQHAQVQTQQRFHSNSGTTTANSTGQIQLKPTFAGQFRTTSNIGGQQMLTREILTGKTIYIQPNGQTTWYAISTNRARNNVSTSAGNTSISGGQLPNSWLQNFTSLTNVRIVSDSEMVNGHETYHLRGTAAWSGSASASATSTGVSTNEQNLTYTEDLWVGKSTYQPYKMTISANINGGKLDTTTTFSNWNSSNFTPIAPPPASDVQFINR